MFSGREFHDLCAKQEWKPLEAEAGLHSETELIYQFL